MLCLQSYSNLATNTPPYICCTGSTEYCSHKPGSHRGKPKNPLIWRKAILKVASHFVNVPLEELESTESRDNFYVMKQRKGKENSVLVVQDVSSKIVFSVVVTSKVSIAL